MGLKVDHLIQIHLWLSMFPVHQDLRQGTRFEHGYGYSFGFWHTTTHSVDKPPIGMDMYQTNFRSFLAAPDASCEGA